MNSLHRRDRKPILAAPSWKWGLALFLLILGGAAAVWQWTPLGEEINLSSLTDAAAGWRDHPLALAAVVAAYVIAGFAFVPVMLLIAATGAAFGPVLGSFYAAAGVLTSAAVAHGLGRVLARPTVHRLAGSRLEGFLAARAKGGILAVAAVRMIPLAPFTVVNLAFGALNVKLRVFLLGTLLGMGPGILSIVVLVDRLDAAARRPGIDTVVWLALAVLLVAALAAISARNADRLKAMRSRNP